MVMNIIVNQRLISIVIIITFMNTVNNAISRQLSGTQRGPVVFQTVP